MSEQLNWSLLGRYVAGEASVEQISEVERWAAGGADRQAMLSALREEWASAHHARPRDVDAAWQRLSARLRSSGPDARQPLVSPAPRWASWAAARLLPLAAVLLVAAGVGMVWRATRAPHSSLGDRRSMIGGETRTAVGERKILDLSDGSQVVLGAASALRVSFTSGRRETYLQGQALFRVRHDPSHPFIVHAGGTVSEDLGTEFGVRAYPGDSEVRVVVREGSVAVRSELRRPDSATVLRANDVALVTSAGRADVSHDQQVEQLLAWTGGELVFIDTPLSEVAGELERWYDVECHFADSSLKGLHFSAPFAAGESLAEVLRVIGKSFDSIGLRVEHQGRVVTFARRQEKRTSRSVDPPVRHEVGA